MAFSFIRTESREWLSPTDREDATPRDADEAVRTLRADWGRWSRLLVGSGALALTLAGTFASVGLLGVALTRPTATGTVDLAIATLSAVVAAAGAAVLLLLWRSGRTLMNALTRWTREPYRRGWRSPTAAGWLHARTVNFDADVFARIAAGSVVLLGAVFSAFAIFYSLAAAPESAALAPLAVAWLVALLPTGLALLGGPMRLAAARGAADPLYRRVSAPFRRT